MLCVMKHRRYNTNNYYEIFCFIVRVSALYVDEGTKAGSEEF